MDQRQIEDLIIDLLAQDLRRDPAGLRAELESLGTELPIDSLLAAEILAAVESACGITLPTDPKHAAALGSVTAYAGMVLEQVRTAEQIAGPRTATA